MTILRPIIVAPDTSHWANWIDGALSADTTKRGAARSFHGRLLDQGKVPFLSWHHLEELLSVDIAANAHARVAYLQSLPLIAWMRFADDVGLGAITDVLAAEVIAFDAGCSKPVEVRDYVRSQLLRTGSAIEAIGHENWVWKVVRPLMVKRRPDLGMISALCGMSTIDERQTIRQLAKQPLRSSIERCSILAAIHASAMRQAMEADANRSVEEARGMAENFISKMLKLMPKVDMPTRDFIVATFVRQGLDPDEVHDECTMAELSDLALFRSQLRIIAEKTGLAFERIKRVHMQSLPSWRVSHALKRFGQKRAKRPGSDIHDQHLAVLAAYTDILYVDKRTHEDFRRVIQKDPELAILLGQIAKVSRYDQLID